MKKWITWMFVSILATAMVGCGSSDNTQPGDMKEVAPSESVGAGKSPEDKPAAGVKAMKGDVD